jgi:hypothetical protein
LVGDKKADSHKIKNPQAIRSPGDFKQGEGGIT